MTGARFYRQTQIAWPTIVPLLAVLAILIPLFRSTEVVAGVWVSIVVYGVILALFATLTVTVTSDSVVAAFGVGLIRKEVPLADVVSFARVRNSWLNGWGIHSYPGGTLYNASGLLGVEFRLSSGRYVCFGTADPEALVVAVRQATGKLEATHDTRSGRAWGPQHTAGVVLGVLALALAGASIYFGMQPPNVVIGFDSFYVSNSLYRNTIAFSDVQSVTLAPELPRVGRRTSGFAAFGMLRGNFNVDGWGNSRLYVNRDVPPFVVIRTGNSFVAVNFKDPTETRTLYYELRDRRAQARSHG